MNAPATNRQRAFDTLTRYLVKANWNAVKLESSAFQAKRASELCPLHYYFQVHAEHEQFLFFIVPQITLLRDLLPKAAEYACHANAGLRIGNFDVNYRAGQVTFKSSINFAGLPLTEELIDNTVQPALTAFDELFPAFAQIIAGLRTLAEAIRGAEYGT